MSHHQVDGETGWYDTVPNINKTLFEITQGFTWGLYKTFIIWSLSQAFLAAFHGYTNLAAALII